MLKWILIVLLGSVSQAATYLSVDMEEVYCQSCIDGLIAKEISGVQKVLPFEREHFARFKLEERANPIEVLQTLHDELYSVESARITVDEPSIEDGKLYLKAITLPIRNFMEEDEAHTFLIHQKQGEVWLTIEQG